MSASLPPPVSTGPRIGDAAGFSSTTLPAAPRSVSMPRPNRPRRRRDEPVLATSLLTFYPPSNLNRDDTGRPKTATVGGVPRLRISSQALKRAWRTSSVFAERLHEHRGERTQRFGEEIERHLREREIAPQRALEIARSITQPFGKLKPENDPAPARTEQLAFIAPEERAAAL